MRDWAQCYRKITVPPAQAGPWEAWLSPASSDPWWDDFLRSTSCGQFQQSSPWAVYKSSAGWHHHRVVLTNTSGISGGFQILWKQSRLGRIGYVSKGPVLAQKTAEAAEAILDLIRAAHQELGLRALILQPPDESQGLEPLLTRRGYLPNRIKDVVLATLLVNLTEGMARVTSRLNATTRSTVKQAQRRGTIIRDGSAEDLDRFFAMMVTTCQRQETKPNPATGTELHDLWNALQPLGIKLMIAQCRGEDVAGQLCIPFGERVTIWKKGWSGQHRDGHPNHLLNYAGLEWACALGCKYWDFAALDEGIATAIISGKPLTEEQKRSRHMFHLGFGGEPRLVPASCIWIENPIFRFGYAAAIKALRR